MTLTMEQLCEREYAKKESFVKELGELCSKYAVCDIQELKYERDAEAGEETVTVVYLGGGERQVNVHMDSLDAIVRDVFKGEA